MLAVMAENSTICTIQTGILPETDLAGVALFSQPCIWETDHFAIANLEVILLSQLN
jgi:hypothetical protein